MAMSKLDNIMLVFILGTVISIIIVIVISIIIFISNVDPQSKPSNSDNDNDSTEIVIETYYLERNGMNYMIITASSQMEVVNLTLDEAEFNKLTK